MATPDADEGPGDGSAAEARADRTRQLSRYAGGDPAAASQLFPLVYDELRELAQRFFRGERADHTLQATALVNEAYLRLVEGENVTWTDRAHFFALAATAMRRILTDHGRRHRAAKRGGGRQRVPLDDAAPPHGEAEVDVLELNDVLAKLESLDERQARIVELRFFGGLNVDEVAHVLGVSKRTVEKEWRAAKAWLSCELSGSE